MPIGDSWHSTISFLSGCSSSQANSGNIHGFIQHMVPILAESLGFDKRFLITESFWTKMRAVSAGAETRRRSDEKNNPELTIGVPTSVSGRPASC
jgi:hypothetical protein